MRYESPRLALHAYAYLNVNGVRRNAREGTTGQVDDNWPSPIAATDPTGGLSLRDLDRALARISEEQRQVILLVGLEATSYGRLR